MPGPAIIAAVLSCAAPLALDGDTIRCANLERPVRLLGIDAPELPGHCRMGRTCAPGNPYASTRELAAALRGQPVTLRPVGFDRYGRTLAQSMPGGWNCPATSWPAAARSMSRAGIRGAAWPWPAPPTQSPTQSKGGADMAKPSLYQLQARWDDETAAARARAMIARQRARAEAPALALLLPALALLAVALAALSRGLGA